jgi:glycerol-3-phosphate dehydrogenase subunit C
MKIGKPVFKAMAKDEPGLHQQRLPAWPATTSPRACSRPGTPAKALQHPLSLVRIAYGLE